MIALAEGRGNWDLALETYRAYRTNTGLWRYEVDAVELAGVLRRMAELHERRGDTAEAALAHADLLHLWRHADGPVVREAEGVRGRLAPVR